MTATPAWTDTTVRLLACAAALVGCGVLAGADSPNVAFACAAIAIVCCLSAVRFDAFIGLAIGLVGAAVLVLVRKLIGDWSSGATLLILAQTVALVALGWLAGSLGGRLRSLARSRDSEASRSVVAVYNSLGLLGFDQARRRLDEEVARSRRSQTPLALLLVRVELDDEAMSSQTRVAVHRAVARLVEAGVGEYDVPFALSESEIGAILVGASDDQAWRTVVPLVDRLTRVTFADRDSGERRRAVDSGRIATGMAFAHESTTSESLMAQARMALDGSVGADS